MSFIKFANSQIEDTAILQQKDIVKIQTPSQLALSLVNQWMKASNMGNIYLTGDDSHLWKTTPAVDLLALDRREHDDLLSSWMTKLVRTWLHPAIGRYFKVSLFIKEMGW